MSAHHEHAARWRAAIIGVCDRPWPSSLRPSPLSIDIDKEREISLAFPSICIVEQRYETVHDSVGFLNRFRRSSFDPMRQPRSIERLSVSRTHDQE
jgi:hypothetical protein